MNEPAVTHLDLMLYVDGELEPSREEEVRAYIDRSPEARAIVAGLTSVGDLVREGADDRAKQAGADGIADAVMRSIAGAPEGAKVVSISERAARRAPLGKRSIAAVAGMMAGGLAAAAAVAFVVWRVAGVQATHFAPTTAALTPPPIPTELMVASAVPSIDEDALPGVSVDAIDFGARTGTIFYVPTESGTTTVVWLSEEEGGGR